MTTGDDTRKVIGLEAFRGVGMGMGPAASIAVLDTSEVRWFARGLPSAEVVDWFTSGGRRGALEERCDVYQLHGLYDIGVKRRSHNALEVKVRRAIGETLELEPGLAALFEEWRKWSPDDNDPMWPSGDVPWIDVHKAVLTRTFMFSGAEVVAPAVHIDESISGCDVEIVVVTIGAIHSWSLAFEAFGPKSDRRQTVRAAWDVLVAESGRFENLGEHFDQPAGYPEWLALIASEVESSPAGSTDLPA